MSDLRPQILQIYRNCESRSNFLRRVSRLSSSVEGPDRDTSGVVSKKVACVSAWGRYLLEM